MTILLILIFLALLFFLLRFLYDRFWDRGLSCRVTFQHDYAVEDETAALQEVLVNNKMLPMPAVEISFHMDRRLQFGDGQNASVSDQSYRRDVFALSLRQQITRTLDFKCVGRGYFRIEETDISAQDLFFTRKYLTSVSQNTEFYVLPRPVPTELIEIPFSRVMGSLLSRKKVYDDPFEFAGLREYSRGDPMKYINWKATARAGKLLTNLHESTLSQKVVLLLDMEGKGLLQFDYLNEAAVRIVCALGERLLLSGIELAVYSNGSDVQTGAPLVLDPISGMSNLIYFKKKLACVQSGNELPFVEDLMPKQKAPGAEDDLLVMVSRSQRQDDADRFCDTVGKREALLVIPYRNEHGELSVPRNVGVVWIEV